MLDLRTQIYAIKASWTSRIITAPRTICGHTYLNSTFQNSEMISI